MSKFNVGDMVRVRDWEDMVEEYGLDSRNGENIMIPDCIFVSKMKEYCGGVFEVADVYYIFGEDRYQLSNCDDWAFNDSMLRLVKRAETLGPVQANILFAFFDAGVEVEDEFVITNKGDNAYDYTIDDKKKMIQALADYFELEINFLTRNCSVEDEMEDVPLETINEDEVELYNGKVVCVKSCAGLTIGKIYNIVDGVFIDDNNEKRPVDNTFIYKDDFWFTENFFIPLVEKL